MRETPPQGRLTRLVVNGEERLLTIQPNALLLDVLREQLGLTGTKQGCETGVCGCCTVLVDGENVKSCLKLAITLEGREITSIEGLAQGGELHPVQAAFVKHGAAQCGFCTPGMIISATALLDRTPNPDETQVREGLSGNLCRCTGYVNIVEAVLDVGAGDAS